VTGWTLLARSLAAMGRFPEAVRAFEHLLPLTPGDAQVYADYADALAMVQGRSPQGRPYELAKRALELDPHLPKALAIAASATLDAGDYKTSLGYWQALAAELPEGSEDRQQVDAAITELRDRARAAGEALPQAGPLVGTAPPAPSAAAASITGSVSVAPQLAAKVDPNAILFIFARSEGGPRMPLAVLRLPARGLPTTFQLDDSLAMSPQMKISMASAVRIEARVSKSGNAMPQPGDLTGSSAVVKPGAREVHVVLDREVP
jgi:cytochrome c-type biogenesis protein CcmH